MFPSKSRSFIDIFSLGEEQTLASPDITPPAAAVGSQRFPQPKGQQPHLVSPSSGRFENWEEPTMADMSSRTDTSTDVDTDEKNQRVMLLFFPQFMYVCINRNDADATYDVLYF